MLPILAELLDMLTYCRPDRSDTERAFVDRFVLSLPGAYRDAYGNVHCAIGDTRSILWSSHTDTVHRRDGRQTLHVDRAGIASLSKRSHKRSHCLGADCTVGVWIMRNMILRGIAGHYVFHADEEIGALGSRWLVDHHAEWLQTFEYAIAFDRRGRSSIITHQRYGRTASDLFALALSEELTRASHGRLMMRADDRGIFTDTAEYAHLISECSNLSVGYEGEHTRRETLDTAHALALLDAVCHMDQSALISDREPCEPEDDLSWFGDWRDARLDVPRSDSWIDCDDATLRYREIASGVDAAFDTRPIYSRDTYLDPAIGDVLETLARDQRLRLAKGQNR